MDGWGRRISIVTLSQHGSPTLPLFPSFPSHTHTSRTQTETEARAATHQKKKVIRFYFQFISPLSRESTPNWRRLLRIYQNSIKKKREREREGDRRGERGGWKEGWCTEGESLARKEGKNEERKGPFILWMMRKRKTGRKQRRNEGEEIGRAHV